MNSSKTLGPYLGGQKSIAKSLRKQGKPANALRVLTGVKKPPRGVRVKTRSPTSSQSSQYGSVLSGDAVMGTGNMGVYGFVNKTTGMVWDPVGKTWVSAPKPSMTARAKKMIENTASSVMKPFKPDRSARASVARKAQTVLSYDRKFGKRVKNLQDEINKLEKDLKVANSSGNQNTVMRKRASINRKTSEMVNLVNSESDRLNKVYKNLGINFDKTPKNKLRTEPGALRRMINKILGTTTKVSFTATRGPSVRSQAGRAAASARRARGGLPEYGGIVAKPSKVTTSIRLPPP